MFPRSFHDVLLPSLIYAIRYDLLIFIKDLLVLLSQDRRLEVLEVGRYIAVETEVIPVFICFAV